MTQIGGGVSFVYDNVGNRYPYYPNKTATPKIASSSIKPVSMADWQGATTTYNVKPVDQSTWQGASASLPITNLPVKTTSTEPPIDITVIERSGDTSSGGVSIAPYQPTYAPIPTPEFPNQLDAETIARLSEDAKNYAALSFAAGYQQLDQNLIDAARRATEEEAAVKPMYWQNMRDAIGMGATAAVRALQGANTLGRLRGGNPGELYSNAQMEGFNQASELENQLGDRVATIYRNRSEAEEDIANLRASYKKEQGLTEAVQRATMMREELERQIRVIQQKFENRLASSADARDWENVQLAYNQFKFNAEQAMWERSMTEKQLSAELQAQAASNQIALARLNSSSAITPLQQHDMDMDKAYLKIALDKAAAEIAANNAALDAANNTKHDYVSELAQLEAKKEIDRINNNPGYNWYAGFN